MHLTDIKKISLIIIIILGINSTSKADGNLPYIDDKLFHFGFSLGYTTLNFAATPSLDSIGGKVYSVGVSKLQPGFTVGMISDLRLNRYLNLRFTPTLLFSSRILNYTTDKNLTRESVFIGSIPISLPLLFKYSAERKENYRPYLIWGGGVSIDLSTDRTKSVLLKPLNFYTEFGAGCDIYFSFFKLAPELKFAIGLNDVLDHNFVPSNPIDTKYTLAISKLTSQMLTLTFNFE